MAEALNLAEPRHGSEDRPPPGTRAELADANETIYLLRAERQFLHGDGGLQEEPGEWGVHEKIFFMDFGVLPHALLCSSMTTTTYFVERINISSAHTGDGINRIVVTVSEAFMTLQGLTAPTPSGLSL
jgi:hypothetical protein